MGLGQFAVIYKNLVVVQCHQIRVPHRAFDVATGKQAWRVERTRFIGVDAGNL